MLPALAPMRHRSFALVWTAGLVSMIGDWVLRIALPVHVYTLTGSTLATGGAVAANVIARLLIGPFAGVYVDRWDRRRTMLIGNLALASVVAPLALVTSEGRVWIVYLLTFCSAVIVQFVDPAEAALVPRLVPPELLGAANGLNALNNDLARLVGPAVGGFVAALGIRVVVGLDVVSFLVAAALLAAVAGTHRAARNETHHVIAELVDGLHLIRRTYVAVVLIGLFFVTSIGEGVLGTLFAPFVLDAVGGRARDLGGMMTAQAIGGIAGALLASRVLNRFPPWMVVGGTMTLFGMIDLAIFNYPRWFSGVLPVLLLFVLVGIPTGIGFAALFTILQVSVVDEYLGRLFAVVGVVSAAGALIGAAGAGSLADRYGVVNLLVVQGSAYVVAGLSVGLLLRGHDVDLAPQGDRGLDTVEVPAQAQTRKRNASKRRASAKRGADTRAKAARAGSG